MGTEPKPFELPASIKRETPVGELTMDELSIIAAALSAWRRWGHLGPKARKQQGENVSKALGRMTEKAKALQKKHAWETRRAKAKKQAEG